MPAERRPLLVRCDAGPRIGHGHVMRSLSMALAWQRRGGIVRFLSHVASPALRDRIVDAGLDLVSLDGPGPHLETLMAHLSHPSWVMFDGYHFDAAFCEAVRHQGHRVLLVDDNMHQPWYSADVLLNQNPGAEMRVYPADPAALQLLGARYVLLRPEFEAFRERDVPCPEVATRILVTLGGADPANATLKVIQALQELPLEVEARVLIGSSNPHRQSLEAAAGDRVRLESEASDVATAMAWADVAVSAGGTTSLELASMGTPSVVLVLAGNQAAGAAALEESGAAHNLGPAEDLAPSDIAREIDSLCRDPRRRHAISQLGRHLVDGRGASRTLAVMDALDGSLAESVRLVQAEPEDARDLWRLANDPGVRANSFSREPIPWEDHVAWLEHQLADVGSRMWLLDLEGARVAQVRYQRVENGTAEVHVSVAAPCRGRGLGTQILQWTAPLAREALGVDRIIGHILTQNQASIKAFIKAGYAQEGTATQKGHDCYRFALGGRDGAS